MINKISILSIMLFVLMAVSCTPEVQTPTEPNIISEDVLDDNASGYPLSGYPIEDAKDESGYPITDDIQDFVEGPEFTIHTPITISDTKVTGLGPAGVPIKLVNVSRVGLFLGETIIDSEGSFVIHLIEPLESGHFVGIQLGNLEGTNFNESDFLYSDTYYERPFVGTLFDMVLVQE